MTRRTLLVLAAALGAAAATPHAAQAQLGGLKRKLEQQMSKAVLGEEKKPAAPTFNDRVLEITDARVGQLVAGLRAEAAAAERQEREQAALDARAAEHQRKSEAHAKCAEPFNGELLRYTGMTMGLAVAAKREQDRTGRVGGPMQDSLKAVTERMIKVKDAMVARCGEGPGDSPFEAMAGDQGEGSDPEAVGAGAAGLGREQYAVLRERVAAYLQARGGSTGSYAYTDAERALLDRRAADLAPFRKLLTE